MRFNSIEISNYRQYKNLNFKFPKNGIHDLHLIIGQNGMGKTNILNAVTWCLYGVEPHLGDASRSLPKINLKAKKEAIILNKDILNIEVKIFTEDNGQLLSFQRKLPINVLTDFEYKDDFIVTVTNSDNDTNIYENNEAKEVVSRYMPEKIREYFYFDGEQLHNYFLTDQNAKIRDSVHTISQVDMLTRIKGRMKKIIEKKQREAGKIAPDIELLNSDIKTENVKMLQHEKNIKELENQILKSEKTIKDNTEYLRGQDNLPELESKYEGLKNKIESLESNKIILKKELKIFIRDYKINLSFYPYAFETLKIISEKENNNSLPPNIDKGLLEKILSEHRCLLCDRDLDVREENKIKNTLDQIKVSSETSHLLINIKSELERIISESKNYIIKKEKLLKNVRVNEDDLREAESALQRIDNEINKFTDREQIKLWHKERSDHENLFKLNNQRLGVENNQLKIVLIEREKLEKKLTSSMSKLDECAKLNEMVLFSKKAKDIVDSIEKDMMHEVKNKMEILTSEYFDKLIWKNNTYKKIILDEKYNLDLIHVDDYSCVGSCSAAERALLALAFTLALHEVSGFNSLLFIDTPVARVSDLNRINFAEVLKEVSKKKQIIMTFSPDEYSDEIKKIFEISASTCVQLNTIEEKYTVFN